MLTTSKCALLSLPLLLLGSLAMAWPWEDPEPGQAPTDHAPLDSLLPVSSLRIVASTGYTRNRVYTGQLEARRASELSFERGGLLLEVIVTEGAHVSLNEPLARLDTRNLEASLAGVRARRDGAAALLAELEAGPRKEVIAVARAAVLELQEELELARTRLARREVLVDDKTVAVEVLDEAQRGVDVMGARLAGRRGTLDELLEGTRKERIAGQRAAVAALDAEIFALEVEIDKSLLRAPFTGMIARRSLDEGAVLRAGDSVLRIVEHEVLEVRVGVPLDALHGMTSAAPFTLTVRGEALAAKVICVLPELEPETRTATVLFSINEAGGKILPGQVAELRIEESVQQPGYWVPTPALSRAERGLWTLYALEHDGPSTGRAIVARRDVEVLHTHGDRAYVRGALNDGEHIIDAGTFRVVPGQEVRPLAVD